MHGVRRALDDAPDDRRWRESESDRRPVARTTAARERAHPVVGLGRTDNHGRFSLRLPPGTSRVELDGGQDLHPGRVTVEASGTTHLSLKQYVK